MTEAARAVREDFAHAVNMDAGELEEWLKSKTSYSVGQKDEGGVSIGHQAGWRTLEVLKKAEEELSDDDYEHMRRVVGFVRRHRAQRPDGDVSGRKWRFSLMNWGHDPIKTAS